MNVDRIILCNVNSRYLAFFQFNTLIYPLIVGFNPAVLHQEDSTQKVLEVAGSSLVALQASGSSRAAVLVAGFIITAQQMEVLPGLRGCLIAPWRN